MKSSIALLINNDLMDRGANRLTEETRTVVLLLLQSKL